MKVLLTGAFGNIGSSTLQELVKRGHEVRCFDLKTPKNEQIAQLFNGQVEVIWGDLRRSEDITRAFQGQEVIIHLAFIIPPLFAKDPEMAYHVNIDGTSALIAEAKQQTPAPRFFLASTFDVYGNTQEKEPPRKVDDPLQPIDDYSKQKVQCEEMLQASGLEWAIFRFCDVPPQIPHRPDPVMFTIPLSTRFEMLHRADAGLAIANGISRPIWNKIWLIGGGPDCQIYFQDYLQRMMVAMGLGELPAEAFTTDPYCTDWLDSSASQALLQYQRHSFDEIIHEQIAAADPGAFVRFIMPLIRPLVRRSILRMSPYFKQDRKASSAA